MERAQLTLNGYVIVYVPEHPKAFGPNNSNHGYYYQHILVVEGRMGRYLHDGEVVHHLDCDRSNNDPSNLIVLASNVDHALLHAWMDRIRINAKDGTKLTTKSDVMVKTEWFTGLSDQQLLDLVVEHKTWTAIGKHFGVSDNAIRRIYQKRDLYNKLKYNRSNKEIVVI